MLILLNYCTYLAHNGNYIYLNAVRHADWENDNYKRHDSNPDMAKLKM